MLQILQQHITLRSTEKVSMCKIELLIMQHKKKTNQKQSISAKQPNEGIRHQQRPHTQAS